MKVDAAREVAKKKADEEREKAAEKARLERLKSAKPQDLVERAVARVVIGKGRGSSGNGAAKLDKDINYAGALLDYLKPDGDVPMQEGEDPQLRFVVNGGKSKNGKAAQSSPSAGEQRKGKGNVKGLEAWKQLGKSSAGNGRGVGKSGKGGKGKKGGSQTGR